MIRIYNTFTKKKEDFSPLKKDYVRLYACGPTVYWFAHIGNMRSFLLPDVLKRTLAYNGFDVKLIMNITDVGHLTDDADDGEDKMILAMKREGKTSEEIARFYTEAFLKDLDVLNIEPAQQYPKAKEHIDQQIETIKAIEKNGFAYTTSDGVYFDTSKLSEYGVLSGQKAEDKQAGARVDMGEKHNATDFALWKLSPEDKKRDMEWESPWGKGFPGWHIECTAMSIEYLGSPFDIHTGGIDHIPVHHENELAQSQGAYGAYHSRFWMHNEFLTIDNGKMSKSLGNLYTINDLVEKGYDPLAYRYFVLGAHYRSKLNFTFEALDAAQNALHRLQDLVRDWQIGTEGAENYEERFLVALNDDLNTPQALAAMWEMVEDEKLSDKQKASSLLKFDQVLGFSLSKFVGVPLEVSEDVLELVKKRETARSEKKWEESDRLRMEVETMGYLIEDASSGSVLKEKR